MMETMEETKTDITYYESGKVKRETPYVDGKVFEHTSSSFFRFVVRPTGMTCQSCR